MTQSIKIHQQVIDDMIAHSKELAPVESCGYLSGTPGQIRRLIRLTNVDNSPEHFSFDPKEQFAALKDARNNAEQLLSVYHSHPESPARMSDEDLRLLQDPSMVYIIVSLMNSTPDVKAFRTESGKSIPVDLEIN